MKAFILFLCFGLPAALAAQLPELVLQTRHARSIEQVAISDDGAYMGTAGAEGYIYLWDLASGLQFQHLATGEAELIEMAFVHGRKQLMLGYESEILLIDLPSGKQSRLPFSFPGALSGMALSPDGTHAALAFDVSTGDNSIREVQIWDMKGRKALARNRRKDDYVNTLGQLEFSPDGKTLYATGDGVAVWRWNWQKSGKASKLVSTQLYSQDALAVSPDGKWLAGEMGAVPRPYLGVWNLSENKLAHQFPHTYPYDVSQAVIDPASEMLIISYYKGTYDGAGFFETGATEALVVAYNLADGREAWRHTQSGGVLDMAIDPATSTLVMVDIERGIQAFSIESGKLLRNFGIDQVALNAICWDSTRQLLWLGGDRGTLNGWNMEEGIIRDQKQTGFQAAVKAAAVHKSGRWAAASQRSIKVWDPFDALIDSFEIKEGEVDHMSFTQEGDQLLVVGTNIFGVIIDRLKVMEAIKLGQKKQNIQASLASITLRDLKKKSSSPFPPGVSYPALGREVELHPLRDDVFLSGNKGQYIFQIGEENFQGPIPIHRKDIFATAFSPKGNHLATGGQDDYVSLMELKGENTYELSGYSAPVMDLAFSADERWLATASRNTVSVLQLDPLNQIGEIKVAGEVSRILFVKQRLMIAGPEIGISLWDHRKGSVLATMVPSGKEDFLTFTPEGYYRATKAGARAVAFRSGKQTYTFDQFDRLLNRPDKVLESLGSDKQTLIQAYRKVANLRNKRQVDLSSYQLPELDRVELQTPATTPEATASVSLEGSAPAMVKYLHTRINGVPLRPVPMPPGQQGIKMAHSFPLIAGENKVQLSIEDNNGVSSLERSLSIYRNTREVQPRLFFLGMASNDFNLADRPLKYAIKDVRDIYRSLSENGKYARTQAKFLLDKDFVRDNLDAAREFLSQAGPEDRIVVYVATHGLQGKEGDFFLASYDTDFERPAERGIRVREIDSLLYHLPCLRRLILLDACHTGEAVEASSRQEGEIAVRQYEGSKRLNLLTRTDAEYMKDLFVDLRRGSGASVIASSSSAQFSYEGNEYQNGVFTYVLRRALADAGKDAPTVGDLQQFVQTYVARLTDGAQQPAFRQENGLWDWGLW